MVCDLYGCAPQVLDDPDLVRIAMYRAARVSGARVLSADFHRFDPQGVTGLLLLAESHLSVHTWPERGYAAVDAYTCGDHTNPRLAVDVLARSFGARSERRRVMARRAEPPSPLLNLWDRLRGRNPVANTWA